jgi:hypothetical protein
MFAEIEGDAKCDQAMVELEVAWLLLIMGTVYLFVSLEQLLTRVFANAVDHLARLISWTAIFLGAAGIYAGNTTMFTLLDGAGWETTLTSIAQLGLLAASLAVGAALPPSWKWLAPSSERVAPLVYVVVLGAGGYAAFFFIAFERPLTWIPPVVGWGRVLLWCAFVLVAAPLIRASAPRQG